MMLRAKAFVVRHRIPLAIGGAGLVGLWLAMRGGARAVPNFQWTSPSGPADKLQYLLDYTQLGFGGQGTVYINSNCKWDDSRQALVVQLTPSTITKIPVATPIGWTCSRFTNAVCGYWLNVGPAFRNRNGYSATYQMIAPAKGMPLKADGQLETFYGYADYATKLVDNIKAYSQVYARWDQLGQVNLFINDEKGSGHTGILLKVDGNLRIRDPFTRKFLKDGVYRWSADGGRPDKVYSAGRTSFKYISPTDSSSIAFDLWSLKAGNNGWSWQSTYPLLFQGSNA